VDTKDLQVREQDGGKYVFAHVRQAGRPTPEVLAEILPKLIAGIKFDKSMKWNDSGVAFSRPIRWLVALLGKTVIPFEYAGVAAGNVTRGLRPYDSPEIEIPSADGYFDEIKKAGIVLDRDTRKQMIVEQVKKAVKPIMGAAILDFSVGPILVEGSGLPLLAEVTNLVEKPTAVLGSFDEEYLSLPEAVLITVMKKHQRYFPVRFAGTGRALLGEQDSPLLPNFIAIRNGDDQHLDLVRQGNEHVLNARFADANFFVREDLKQPLEAYRPKLATLIFQKQLGSMLDKSKRIEKLVNDLISMLGLEKDEAVFARRAAHLAKADLATQMVTEMTSLQGIIGREYALRSGENQAVADAIGEQYQPVPKTKIGLAVALADRLDSLTGLFAMGLAPTGTKDPFGLRRAAIGVVQPLIEHGLSLDVRAAVSKAAGLQPIEVKDEGQVQVLDFIAGRLSGLLKEAGYKYDLVDAVLAEGSNNPTRAVEAVRQLQTWVGRKDWSTILTAFARCVRITRDQKQNFRVNEKLLVEKEEQDLFAALKKAESASRGAGSVDDFLNVFVPMIPAVNAFFDKVLVMSEDKAVRENRLGLLQRIAASSSGMADLSKLEGF